MSNPGVSRETAEEIVRTVNQCVKEGFKLKGAPAAVYEAARRLKIPGTTAHSRLRGAKSKFNLKPNPVVVGKKHQDLTGYILEALRSRRHTLAELAGKTQASTKTILDEIDRIKQSGLNIVRSGDSFAIMGSAEPAFIGGPTLTLESRKDNTFTFGAVGDLHAASKYCRWDVREDLYKRIANSDAQCVLDTGNWIDGEASFNRFDLEAHGLDEQVKLLATRHPKIKGLHTYAVWGDDHEGWYVQREGIDVGRYAESVMRSYGHEWTNLGFMEATVILKNRNSGAVATLAVVHPGGGASYATSYAIQKIIESLEGGEKPNVGLYGHYHKMWSGIIRNVFVLQTGTAQEQTPFMRKKKLEAHVGGCLVKLEQDPETGGIIGFTPTMWKYYSQGFHQGRWSRHGPVTKPPRSIKTG